MNYGRYLEECIKSVLDQKTNFPFKINHIIMDGGSTDETEQILKKYEGRIHYYINSGEGQTPALNHAMKIIEEKFPNTNYIGWLNADDYYNPIWLQSSISVLRKEPKDVAMTCGRITQVGASPILQKKIDANERRENNTPVLPYVRINRMVQGNSIIQPTVFIRMSAFKELKKRSGFYFNNAYNFTQDLDLWHRFLGYGFRIRRISERVSTLRRHQNRMSHLHRKQQIIDGNKCRNWLKTKLKPKKNYKIAFLWYVKGSHVSGFWENKQDSMQYAIARLSENYHVRLFVSTGTKRPRKWINGQDITFYDYHSSEKLLKLLSQFNPDMIFLNLINVPLWRQVINRFPATWKAYMDYGSQSLIVPFPEKVDAVLVQQEYQAKICAEKNTIERKKIKVNAFCIRTDYFKPIPVAKLYTGVMLADFRRDIKRQYLLINAWKYIPGKLLLIGRFERSIPNNYHLECMELAKKLGVMDRITFMNGCSPELLPTTLSMAKIGYMASSREGGSRAQMEKMACGLPILVMSDCAGAINLIKVGVDGLVANPKTSGDIARATKKLLLNYREMGTAASERIRSERPYDRMLAFYQNLIKEAMKGNT